MKGRNGDEKRQARNMDALPPVDLMGLWEEVYSCVKPPRRETSNIHEMDISTNIFAKYETGSPSTVDLELSGKNYHHHQKPKDRQFLFFFFFPFFKPSLPLGEFVLFACSYSSVVMKTRNEFSLHPRWEVREGNLC